MAWQIAVVVDEGKSTDAFQANLSILLGQMPVWAITYPDRVPLADKLREQWNTCWYPEPALTLVRPTHGDDRIGEIADLIPTIQEHHCRMTAVRLFGIEGSERLTNEFAGIDFKPVTGSYWAGLGFAKPLSRIEGVPDIKLDATGWTSADDFYTAFFATVGAPEWHGRNLNALNDSIGGGAINKIEVPYRLILQNTRTASAETPKFIRLFEEVISDLQANGCPVEMQIEP